MVLNTGTGRSFDNDFDCSFVLECIEIIVIRRSHSIFIYCSFIAKICAEIISIGSRNSRPFLLLKFAPNVLIGIRIRPRIIFI